MTEYWKSVGNYYCNYCKVFVRNDSFNRRQHEASPRHQGALKRQVRDIHRTAERDARDLQMANRELARIGGKTAPIKQTEDGPKKINIGTRPKKKEQHHVDTLDDSEVYRAALAAQALPGQWSTVESSSPQLAETDATQDDLDKVKQEPDEARIEHEDGNAELDLLAQESSISKLKRRRDGADEDLIKFTVQTKKYEPADDETELGDDIPVVSFKKKKGKNKQVANSQ